MAIERLPLIWLSKQVSKTCLSLSNGWSPLETGGILLGWRDADGSYVITGLIGGGPNAVHSTLAFTPDDDWQMQRLREAFDRTSGDLNYLGEWHSHPASQARMSGTDKRTLRKTSKAVPEPVMIIFGQSSGTSEICGWIGTPRLFAMHRKARIVEFDLPTNWPSALIFDAHPLDPATAPR